MITAEWADVIRVVRNNNVAEENFIVVVYRIQEKGEDIWYKIGDGKYVFLNVYEKFKK